MIDFDREPMTLIKSDTRIIYVAEDGTKFHDRDLYSVYERRLIRERVYNFLLKNRTWWEKLLGIKPTLPF